MALAGVQGKQFVRGEYRLQTIRLVVGIVALLVAHAVCEDDDGTEGIRIISARRAERSERRRYEKENYRSPRT